MRILVTGGSGTLGRHLQRAPCLTDHVVLAPSHADLDITDEEAVRLGMREMAPDVVIHGAAVIRAQNANDPTMWRRVSRVNVWGTALLARECQAVGARLIYLSTDFVFDGDKPGGRYTEDDLPNPLGYYPLSKYAGERAALGTSPSLLIRTTFNDDSGWPYPRAFTDRFTSKQKASVTAEEVARAALSDLVGVIHIGGARQSYFDFARTLTTAVEPMTMADIETKDPLPIDTSLDASRWIAHCDRHGLTRP